MMTEVVRVFQIMSAMMMVMMVMTVMVVVVNVFQILRKPNLDSFSRRGLIRSDKANFLSFWSLNIQRLFDASLMCYASFVLGEKNMAHLLLWRQILTGGSRGVCIQGLEVKRSQSWEVVNMSFFACPTHRRAHPLQKSSSTTSYTFALCTFYNYIYMFTVHSLE